MDYSEEENFERRGHLPSSSEPGVDARLLLLRSLAYIHRKESANLEWADLGIFAYYSRATLMATAAAAIQGLAACTLRLKSKGTRSDGRRRRHAKKSEKKGRGRVNKAKKGGELSIPLFFRTQRMIDATVELTGLGILEALDLARFDAGADFF